MKNKTRPNLVEWFEKHRVSGDICSLDFATTRAVSYLENQRLSEQAHDLVRMLNVKC